ncbi:hypothetical protein D3C72_1518040 [compost metagenome]
MQQHVDHALHDKAVSEQGLHPHKAAIGQHAHFQLCQVAIGAKDGAVGKAIVIEHQTVMEPDSIDDAHGQETRHDSQKPEQFCFLHRRYG